MWGASQIDDDVSSIRDLKSFILNVQSWECIKDYEIEIQNICKTSKVMEELLCSSAWIVNFIFNSQWPTHAPIFLQTSSGLRLLLTKLSMILGSWAPRTTSHIWTRSGLIRSPNVYQWLLLLHHQFYFLILPDKFYTSTQQFGPQ